MGWKEWIMSGGAVVLAFFASQHHNLHMLLLALGLSSAAGMSFLNAFPILRRGMLLISLLMVAFTFHSIKSHRQSGIIRTLSVLSILISLGLIVWTIYQFGI